MCKKYFYFLFLCFNFIANAQNDIVIKGSVYDINSQVPLEMATVYFTNAKDSTLVEYTTTDKNGFFKINTKKYDKAISLKIDYLGYQTYAEVQNNLLESKDFGKLYLLKNTTLLKEVIVKTQAAPIKIKKDTLEINAASFKVRPDANVETLFKQLPGFEVDSDGKITVNGKEVTQFLVNGKAFFDKDGAIALKNLPADIINKVQVSDFKTKKEELSKQESSSDYSSINLTIDEKKNKGYFGKILGGYGTDDRYESSMIMNYFNNKQKISLLASANNINAPGFAMDEVFDNMGGGRNTPANGRATANAKGITTSSLVGLNYSDDWSKKLLATGSYNFSDTDTQNNNSYNQTELSSRGNVFTSSKSVSQNENTSNKANFELEYKISPSIRLVIAPTISQTKTTAFSDSDSKSKDENDADLNDNKATSNRESEAITFSNSINFNKSFEKKARNLSLVLSNNLSETNANGSSKSETIFYQGSNPDIIRDQTNKNLNESNNKTIDIEYTEPITDSLRIRIGTELSWNNNLSDSKTFDFDDTSKQYSALNQQQTNYTSSDKKSITPNVGLTFEKNKFTVNLNSSSSIVNFDNFSNYQNTQNNLNQKHILPLGRAQIRYRIDKSKFFTFRYEYSKTLPTATQLMPVQNLSNTLNTVTGNPNLDLNQKTSLNLNYRNFNQRNRSGYNLTARADFYDSEVVSISKFNPNGQKETTYTNVSGTYTASLGGSYNQTIKQEAHVLRYGLGLNTNYSLDKGFTNAVLYDAKSLGISPRINLAYDYGDLFTASPTYTLSYNERKYNNNNRPSATVVHKINVQTTNYWPKNWTFGNDFGYTYNSSISAGFKKEFYAWNTSLSYGFFNKKMTLKVKIYDILNQNQSVARTLTATLTRDEENTVLKRYAMFSLLYKVGSFSGKQKRNRPNNRPEPGMDD